MHFAETVSREVSDGVVSVIVSRQTPRSGLIVSSPNAQPLGNYYRYQQYVRPEAVVQAVEAWAEALPLDYCLRGECSDMRRHWWSVLRARLAEVPCVGDWEAAL